jgi:hypothetical protein
MRYHRRADELVKFIAWFRKSQAIFYRSFRRDLNCVISKENQELLSDEVTELEPFSESNRKLLSR